MIDFSFTSSKVEQIDFSTPEYSGQVRVEMTVLLSVVGAAVASDVK